MKKDYHFEKEDQNFDETIRLDMINEKVKELKKQPDPEDELGDASAFLDAFQSETFELPEEDFFEDMKPVAEEWEAGGDTIHTLDTTAIREALEDADTLVEPLELPPVLETEEEPPEWEEEEHLFGLGKRNATLLALAAVLACFMGFVFVRCTFHPTTVYEEPSAELLPALIWEVAEDELLLYDVTAKTEKVVSLTEESKITDEMNRDLLPAQLQIGDLVLVGLDEEKEELVALQYSGAVSLMEKSGLKVNTASRTLEGEGETFSYGEGAMFLYEDQPIAAESIEPCDILELKVYEDKVWCIEVAEYHGYITVKHTKDVKNGKFQLDEEPPIALQEAEKIPVRAGLHTVKITGDTIEPKTETITVKEGEESFCDVSRVQEKMGVIIVNANVSDYKLYINGSAAENPAVLPFGEYEAVILKGGYEEWSQKISLQQDSVTVQAELKELKQPEPPKEEGKKEPFQFGTLTITANCDGAVVYINGEQYGIAPMEVNLPYNSYTIRLEKEGYAPYEKGITIGEPTAALHAQLQ